VPLLKYALQGMLLHSCDAVAAVSLCHADNGWLARHQQLEA
jgi:hypothetical protein